MAADGLRSQIHRPLWGKIPTTRRAHDAPSAPSKPAEHAVTHDPSADDRPISIDDFGRLRGTARPIARSTLVESRSSADLCPHPFIAQPDRSIRVRLAFCQLKIALREFAWEAGDAIA